jgi:hypothetical protein
MILIIIIFALIYFNLHEFLEFISNYLIYS